MKDDSSGREWNYGFMEPHAIAWGKKAVYLVNLIAGWGDDLPDWQFDKYRREAMADARLAARAATLLLSGPA